MTLTKTQSTELLSIARNSIKLYQEEKKYLKIKNVEPWMIENRATFVTLKKKNQLRGCIGHIQAIQDLYKDVIDNSVASAFFDPRFPELGKSELGKLKIEISILSVPEKIECKTKEELLSKINNTHGLILTDGYNGATFLPQVWLEIPNKEEFLSTLCLKAGLKANDWATRTSQLSFQTYVVDFYEE